MIVILTDTIKAVVKPGSVRWIRQEFVHRLLQVLLGDAEELNALANAKLDALVAVGELVTAKGYSKLQIKKLGSLKN